MKTFWLSINLASDIGSLAIHAEENGKVACVGERLLEDRFAHSERMLSELSRLLEDCHVKIYQISKFISVKGPGSFTGLRIAISTLKAFFFVLNKPIELLNGSEVRALHFLNSQDLAPDHLYVLTYIAQNKYQLSEFKPTKNNEVSFVHDSVITDFSMPFERDFSVVLVDEKIPTELIPQQEGCQIFTLPLTAKFLGGYSLMAKLKETASTFPEQVQLSPQYFGDKF